MAKQYLDYSGLSYLWGKIKEYIKSVMDNHTHTKSDITDFPSSLPASDVSAWAKAPNKPTYTKSEVGLGNVDNTADANKSVNYANTAGTADALKDNKVNGNLKVTGGIAGGYRLGWPSSTFGNDFLLVNLSDRLDLTHCPTFFYTNDSQGTINRPVTGVLMGIREVFVYDTSHAVVKITELTPVNGRVWTNFYNASGWSGWMSSYPITYTAAGAIAQSSTGLWAAGTATVSITGNVACIDYSYRITTAATNGSSDFAWGLSATLLKARNSSIPNITPIVGGTWHLRTFGNSTPTATNIQSYEGYGTINSSSGVYWRPARQYKNSDNTYSLGPFNASTFGVGTIIEGRCYGTI